MIYAEIEHNNLFANRVRKTKVWAIPVGAPMHGQNKLRILVLYMDEIPPLPIENPEAWQRHIEVFHNGQIISLVDSALITVTNIEYATFTQTNVALHFKSHIESLIGAGTVTIKTINVT